MRATRECTSRELKVAYSILFRRYVCDAKIIVIFLNNALSAAPSADTVTLRARTSAALYNDGCLFFSRNGETLARRRKEEEGEGRNGEGREGDEKRREGKNASCYTLRLLSRIICVRVYIHIYTHIYIYIHTHTYV